MNLFEKSFYEYLMTERGNSTDHALARFAEAAFNDHSFPKQSSSYEELSNYLELSANYLPSMTLFDEAWEKYQAQHKI